MGARGPLPKDAAKRQRRNVSKPKTKVPSGARASHPELAGEFLPQTREWYAALASAPWSSLYEESDWQVLIRTAYLVDAFFKSPSAQLAAEIRQNEARLGATAADRARLGWEVDGGPGESQARDGAKPSRQRPDPRKT